MSAEQIVEMFRNLGFPVAVAAYVLVRLDHTLLQVRDELRAVRALLGERRRLDGDESR